MKVRGEVFSGVLRGTPLIKKYYPRLIGMLNFHPYPGTMDIKLERGVDIAPFATKTIEHVLQDGTHKINAYLAPIKLRKLTDSYVLMQVREREREIKENFKALRKAAVSANSAETEDDAYECWAIQFKDGVYGNDIVEMLAKDSIKERLKLEDGDKVEIEFADAESKKKVKMRKSKIDEYGITMQ